MSSELNVGDTHEESKKLVVKWHNKWAEERENVETLKNEISNCRARAEDAKTTLSYIIDIHDHMKEL